jgi:hypothetical protein
VISITLVNSINVDFLNQIRYFSIKHLPIFEIIIQRILVLRFFVFLK